MKHGGSGKKSEGPGKREEERNNKTMTKQCNVKEYTRHKAMSEEGRKEEGIHVDMPQPRAHYILFINIAFLSFFSEATF